MQHDEATKAFMHEVAGVPAPAGPADAPRPVEKQLEKVIRTARGIGRNPRRFVARKLVAAMLPVDADAATKVAADEDDVDALRLYQLLNSRYNRDWWDWEPETLWHSLETDMGEPPSAPMRECVMALQVVVNTNAPFEHWHIFENTGHAFFGDRVDFGMLQPLELSACAHAIRVLQTIRPKQEFDDEVWAYIAAVAKSSGVVYLPPGLFGGSGRPQDTLDGLNNDLELKQRVAQRWPKPPTDEDDLTLQIQLLRLKEIQDDA